MRRGNHPSCYILSRWKLTFASSAVLAAAIAPFRGPNLLWRDPPSHGHEHPAETGLLRRLRARVQCRNPAHLPIITLELAPTVTERQWSVLAGSRCKAPRPRACAPHSNSQRAWLALLLGC